MPSPRNLYIGLMSGTSLDGIDVALVEITADKIQLRATHSHPMPAALRDTILAICQPANDEINRAGRLHLELGEVFAAAVQALLQQEGLAACDIAAIGSHGQTVRHRPDIGFSLQLGSGDVIATRTGIATVCDFRNHDMVLGGQGAPFAPAFHRVIFVGHGRRAIVNIGGMANASLLDGSDLVAGFDSGPGNALMNYWCEHHRGQPFDDKGRFAASGTLLPRLLKRFLNDDFFQQKGPKSTGREHFNADWLNVCLQGNEAPADVQATLTELTAASIAQSLADFSPTHAYICGGGSKNDFLLQRLAAQLPACAIAPTDAIGWPADWIEAACFAWLAHARINRLAATSPVVTGARRAAISGAVYLP